MHGINSLMRVGRTAGAIKVRMKNFFGSFDSSKSIIILIQQ